MRWKDKNNDGFYEVENKGFYFTISHARDYDAFYVVVSHQKKDIRLNTLWENKTFKTFELAEEFCETFDYRKHRCIGDNT